MTLRDNGDLRGRVQTERYRRGWSARTASVAGGISNTTWNRYENGDTDLTPTIQVAIATAFGWPTNWPETDDATPPADVVITLKAWIAALEIRINAIESQLRNAR